MHPQSRVQNEKAHERSHHRFTGAFRRFLHDGATAYSVLSPATGLSCHRRLRVPPQTWRQRRGVRTTRLCRPQLRHSSTRRSAPDAARVHRIQPRVRDDRDTPLGGTGRRCL